MVFAKTSIPQDQEAVHHVHLPAVKEESVTETLGPENAEVDPEVLPTTDITDASWTSASPVLGCVLGSTFLDLYIVVLYVSQGLSIMHTSADF